MIRINNKIGSLAPEILSTKGATKSQEHKTAFDGGVITFSFATEIYGHKEVKEKLIRLQNYKCCFCESKIGHISYGDVEHFRPKSGWVQHEEPINQPGYYWLAYDWENLFLSCQLCNQRNKKNYFPLANEEQRALNHNYDVDDEHPLFVHPISDNPEDFIEFNENEPRAINGNSRGDITITKLGLDRKELNEQRKRTLNMIFDIYDLAKGYPDTTPQLKTRAKEKISKYHEAAQQDETEYASMLRCFFKRNPIDF
jgi:uncharacterized protein (TIGR02646 family)